MSKRACLLASVLLPVLLWSPAWAQDAPVATAPIPPPVKAAPEQPFNVVPKRSVPPAAAEKEVASTPAATAAAPHPVAKTGKPAARIKEADRKKSKAPAEKLVKTAAKAEKKAEKKIEKNVAASAKVARPRRWVEERRWAPPPPFGPSWYERYDRGPMAYAPYGGGMRVPPPVPSWDE